MSTAAPERVVIAGGSTAGIAAAQALRQEGFTGELHIVAAETHDPYDRTALSKAVLRGGPTDVTLLTSADHHALDAVWHRGRRAADLDRAQRLLTLDDGTALGFDGLVLATGATPRTLGLPALDGVLTLRDLDDAQALAAALQTARSIALVGGGFVGLEVAAVAAERGLQVTVLEADAAPLRRAVGAQVGRALARRHEARGVTLLTGARVCGLSGTKAVASVQLADGRSIPADLVLVGVGAAPATGWLTACGLGDAHGVACDATLATAMPGVVAAGDIARWPHPRASQPVRTEHYEHAQLSGAHAAARLLHGPEAGPYGPLPFVWSEQLHHTVHVAGFPSPDATVELLEGDLDDGPFAVAYTDRDLTRSAVLTLDSPRAFRRLRCELSSQGAPT